MIGATGGAGVRVAVIDSGFDRSIDDARVGQGIAFAARGDGLRLEQSDDDNDQLGHGTACADLVLQVMPRVRIIPIRIFDSKLDTSPEILTAAIEWAMNCGIRVINLSVSTNREDAVASLYRVCEVARRRGVVIVAAGGTNARNYPAAFEPVIGVFGARMRNAHAFVYRAGAVFECGARAIRQNARGLAGYRSNFSGTSFATPIVTGHVARLLDENPHYTLEDIREQLYVRALRCAEL